MDEFRYQNTYELTKEEVSRVFGGRPPVRGTCQLMETIEGRGTTEADLWRDNQDENSATIKMRMPEAADRPLIGGRLAAADGGRA